MSFVVTSAESTARPAPPEGVLFVVLGAMAAFLPVAMDLYLPALPQMGRELQTEPGAVQLTLAAFFGGVACGQFLYGPASDRYGRRPLFFLGVSLYIAASIACAFSTSIEALIFWRFVQALGAASGMVITRAIVSDLFEAREAARFFSLLMLVQGLGPILAPLLGGWIVAHASWRVTFYVVAAFGAAVAVYAFLAVPETREEHARAHSKGESLVASCLAVLRNGPLMRIAIVGALGSASFFTYLSNAAQLLIDGYGVRPDHFGYYFGANALGTMIAAQVNRRILAKMHPNEVLDKSIYVVFGLGVILLVAANIAALGMWGVLVPLFCLLASFQFVMPNAMALAQGADRLRPGAVSAITGSMGFLAGAAVATISGALYDGTARPMAVVIVCATGIALALRATTPKRAPA